MRFQTQQRIFALACLAGLACGWRDAGAQPVSGSAESGLQELAQAIVNKSAQNDADSIAVLPFPNSDGSCSVLSTYLADELIQSLFTVAGAKLRIIERSQLEALLREVKIGDGGLLNPATTQKLGNLSGVKALALGTVAVIGDHIRINARLISTSNGQTVSAAAVSIARNGEIDGLMQHQIGSSGGLCGNTFVGTADATPDPGGNVVDASSTSVQATRSITQEGITFAVQNVSRSQDKKSVSVIVALAAKAKSPLQVVMTSPKPSLLDDQANLAEINQVSGLANCNGNFSDAAWCAQAWQRTHWTTLSPGAPTMLLLRFTSQQPISGSHVSLAAGMLVAPAEDDSQGKEAKPKLISLSFANLPIPNSRTTP